MRFHRLINTSAHVIAAAVAQVANGPACADSASGPLTAGGNAMNPDTVYGTRERDPAGLGPYRVPASRTPSGQLYDIPYLPPLFRKTRTEWGWGWEYSGFIEAGVLGADASNRGALFRRYRDIGNGLYLNNFHMEAHKPDGARFVEIDGGGVGKNDQFYGVRFGRYNDYRVNLSYSEIPHVFSTTAKPIWQGVGTGTLLLPAVPGAAAGAGGTLTGDTELGLVRRKAGARIDLHLTDTWTLFSSYSLERRKGTRAFGGSEGNGETVEPIDHATHELLAGLQFADAASQFNLTLSASLFRNDVGTLTWETPIRKGRLDLYPDNEAYHAKMEYARALPAFFRGRFNATVALGTMRQNDSLIAPTAASGTDSAAPAGTGFNFDLWNTAAALSRQKSNASIDTRLVDLGLSLAPADKLTLRATLRHYETRNHGRYTAFNPQTGQFGSLIQDTNPAGVFNGTNNIHYRSIPFQGGQDNYKLSGQYQVRRRAVLSAELEREDFHRDYRERDNTWENRLRLAYADRGFEAATVRLSYEFGSRRGSQYTSNPYQGFYTASSPAYTDTAANALERLHNLENLRKFDLADRDQHVLKARVNYLPRADIDVGVTLQSKLNAYRADFGRIGTQAQNALNLDLSYLPSAASAFTAYYSYQAARMKQADAADVGSALAAGCAGLPASCSDAFGAPFSIYPADRFWSAASKDRTAMFGLGLRHDFGHDFGKPKLDLQYAYSSSRSPLSYAYASANALQSPALAAIAGNGFPDLTYSLHVFDMGLRFAITQRTAVRFFYHFEMGKLDDWHYNGLNQSTVVNSFSYLDVGPRNYRANVLGAFLQVKL
jgi:MtrB/PioB family decaheme-associated outer membrane protein